MSTGVKKGVKGKKEKKEVKMEVEEVKEEVKRPLVEVLTIDKETSAQEIADLKGKSYWQEDKIKEINVKLVELQKELIEEQESAVDKTNKYEEDLTVKSKEQSEMQMKHDELLRITQQEKATIERMWRDRLEGGEKDKQAMELQKDQKMRELEDQLENVREFQQYKRKYEAELELWKEKYEDLYKDATDEKYASETRKLKKMEHIRDDYKKQKEHIERNAMDNAKKDMGKIEKNIQRHNNELLENIKRQKDEVVRLKKEQGQVFEQNKMYKRDMIINAERVEAYAKRQVELNKKLKEMKCEIMLQKQSLRQTVKDFETEKEIMKQKYDGVIQEQEMAIKTIHDQLRTKIRDLKNVKGLAQMILDQRAEVETFFLEALDQIKEEVRKKILKERKDKKAGIHTQKDDTRKAYGEKVDLNDLDWEDRERVLRLLFSKMNAGVPPPTWKEPLHQLPISKLGELTGNRERPEIDYSDPNRKLGDDEEYNNEWAYQE